MDKSNQENKCCDDVLLLSDALKETKLTENILNSDEKTQCDMKYISTFIVGKKRKITECTECNAFKFKSFRSDKSYGSYDS